MGSLLPVVGDPPDPRSIGEPSDDAMKERVRIVYDDVAPVAKSQRVTGLRSMLVVEKSDDELSRLPLLHVRT